MSRIRIVAPGEDLLAVIASELSPAGKDYTRNCVVFPGKRPAHFLRKRLATIQGTAFLPPALYSIDSFAEHLYRTAAGGMHRLCDEIDALAVLHETHSAVRGMIGEDESQSFESFLPGARKLLGELEELLLADIAPDKLRSTLRGIGFPRFVPLARYYEKFYSAIASRGLITRAGMYREAAHSVDSFDESSFDRIVLAGFFALTRVEQQLFSSLLRRDNVVACFENGEGLQRRLARYGMKCDVPSLPDEAAAELSFTRSPDVHGQMAAVAADLADSIGRHGAPDERTAIVLPSADALFPLIHNVLPLLPPDGYNIAMGFPLARTPIFGFLSSLMDCVESVQDNLLPPAEYLKFVLHPYTKNIRLGKFSEITRIMFHELETDLIERRSGALISLEELEQNAGFFDELASRVGGIDPECTADVLRGHLVSIHDRTIRRFRSFVSCADFASRAIDVISDLFDHSTARLHPFSRRYTERLIDALRSLKGSLLAEIVFRDDEGYFSFFRSLAAGETVPFPGTPLNGLQVLGLLETRNIPFDTIYLCDANDDVLPGTPPADLFLPQQIRTKLGLETSAEREELAGYYLDLAVRNAKKVFFSYSEGGGKEKSRFVQKLIWRRQKRDREVETSRYEKSARYRVTLANGRPGPVEKTSAMIRFLGQMRFSAKKLDILLRCPLKFYYSYILSLSEKEEASAEIDAQQEGNIVHGILAAYFKPLRGKTLKPELFSRERLETTVEECFAARFGEHLTGTAWLLRRQVADHLWEYIERVQIPQVRENKIIIKGLEMNLEAEKNGRRFLGRVDRIELRNGRNVIIDYKTGARGADPLKESKLDQGDPATWPEAIGSFQLPLYMLLYSDHVKTDVASIDPALLFLGKNHLGATAEVVLGNGDRTPSEIYGIVEPVIFGLLKRLTDPEIPFEPTASPEKDCPGCEFKVICGTQWVQGWND